MLDASKEQKTFLDDYDQLNYFNAGSSPIANVDSIKDILEDGRVKLFVNKSDLISQTYNQERTDDTRVSFAEASWNPLTSHGMQQWSNEDKNFDTPVNWGPEFFTDFKNNNWETGANTSAALESLPVESKD